LVLFVFEKRINQLLLCKQKKVTAAVKRALSQFESAFATQIDVAQVDPESSMWRSVKTFDVYGLEASAATLLPGDPQPAATADISYTTLTLANALGLSMVGITATAYRSDAVFPTDDSVNRAVVELGLDYNPAVSRVVDLSGSTNYGAWPVIFTSFLVVRLNTLRAGATCNTRLKLLRFAETLFDPSTTTQVQAVATSTGSVLLPQASRQESLSFLQSSLMCNNQTVVDTTAPTMDIVIGVPEGLTTVIQILVEAFQVASAQAPGLIDRSAAKSAVLNVQVVAFPSSSDYQSIPSLIESQNGTGGLLLTSTTASAFTDNVVTFPFAAVAITVRVNWCGSNPAVVLVTCAFPAGINLNVSASILVGIYQQVIVNWDDPAIQALNPSINLPNATILAIPPPFGFWRDVITSQLQLVSGEADFTFNPALATPINLQQSFAILYKEQYSIMLNPATTDVSLTSDEQTIIAALWPSLTVPTDASIAACAQTPGAYNAPARQYDLTQPANNNCYPMVVQLVLAALREQGSACSPVVQGSVLNFDGFLPPVITVEDSTAVRILQLLRWLVASPVDYSSPQEAALGARINTKSFAFETAVDQTLRSIHTTALFDVVQVVDSSTAQLWATKTSRAQGLNDFTCSGVQLSTTTETLNLIPDNVIYGVGYVLCFLTIGICLGLAFWVFRQRNRKVIRFASPNFLWTVLLGASITALTLIPLSVQDTTFNRDFGYSASELALLDVSCTSIPWLFSFGLVIQFSALFIKMWRLVVIFDNPLMRILHNLKDVHLLLRILPVLFVLGVYLALWTGIDPPHWDRLPTELSSDNVVLSSVGLCTVNNNPWVWIGPLLFVIFGLLLVGLYLCYKARALPSEFQESGWVTLALLLHFESLVLATPILAMTANNPLASCK